MGQGVGRAATWNQPIEGFWPRLNVFKKQQNHDKVTFLGHTYSALSSRFKVFSELTSLSDGVQHIVQFCIGAVSAASRGEIFRGRASLLEVDSYIDGIRTYSDINYFIKLDVKKDWKNAYLAGVGSGVAFLSSSLSGLAGVADYVGLVDLKSAASTVGSLRIFGVTPLSFVQSLPISRFGLLSCTVGYFLAAIDTGMKIHAEGVTKGRMAYLAYCIASLVAKVFLIAVEAALATTGGAVTAGVLQMVSAGFGAWSVYRNDVARD